MSRGLGTFQRALLAALADGPLTVAELAERTDRQPRQVRTAIHALARRELVVVTRRSIGWKGRGEYGPFALRWAFWERPPTGPDPHRDLPTAVAVKKGDRMPTRGQYWAWRDVEFVRVGVPVSGLVVWLPEQHAEAQRRYEARVAEILGVPAPADPG